MSFINHATNEVHCKVVYFGAGLGGKTTNIQYIYEHTQEERKGELRTIGSENERTLFFDFLPLSVGKVHGFDLRFHLYSIPGQTFYDISQDFILKGVDGIVFVVDSQEERMEANIESYESLEKRMAKQAYDFDKLPLVFQYNKRDVQGAVPLDELQATFNAAGKPYFEAVASRGEGVMDTLQTICQLIITDLKGGDV